MIKTMVLQKIKNKLVINKDNMINILKILINSILSLLTKIKLLQLDIISNDFFNKKLSKINLLIKIYYLNFEIFLFNFF